MNKEFTEYIDYQSPIVKVIDDNVTIGIYKSIDSIKDTIICIKNYKTSIEVLLYSKTLVNTYSSFIEYSSSLINDSSIIETPYSPPLRKKKRKLEKIK